jgi:1,4-dihydroxy-6-naphthoate synthase
MKSLSLGYSPCPNDTFVFTAWAEGRIDGAPPVEARMEDIDALNRWAGEGEIDVVKVSFHALGFLRDRYRLLHSGGALGRGCGPLVVAREPLSPEELKSRRIVIPGERTTAALLLRLFAPGLENVRVMPFHRIMAAVRDGEADAGLIIHESRFTYPSYGLLQVVDLGEWWERETGHAIPLAGIAIRRDADRDVQAAADRALSASVRFAYAHPEAVWPTIRLHAQEMEDEVMRRHIELYVNERTVDYGKEGVAAIRYLFDRAAELGVMPKSDRPLFWDDEGEDDRG